MPQLMFSRPFYSHRAIALRLVVLRCILLGFTLSLMLLIGLPSVWAQTSDEIISPPGQPADNRAPIMVDGQVLIRVGGIEGFSAQMRADSANEKIEHILRSTPPEQPIEVIAESVGDLTTLRIRTHPRTSEHLLTVTEGDFIPGVLPLEQAELWRDRLQTALARAQVERTPQYRHRATWIGLGLLAGAIALHLLVQGVRRFVNRVANRAQTRQATRSTSSSPAEASLQTVKTIVQPLLFCLQIAVWVVLLLYVAGLFPLTRLWRYQTIGFLQETLTEPIFDLGDMGYSIFDLLKILVLAIGLWVGVRAVTVIVRSRLLRSIGIDPEIQEAIAVSMQFLLTGIGLIIILQGLGFDVSSLAIVASVLGVGIGFGLQNLANSFISGLVIVFERPIRVGDFINLGELAGTVERIGARSTEIRTLDYITIIVPNSDLLQSRVINWSHGHPVSRLHVPFGVAYGSNIRRVRTSVLEAAKVHPEILRYPQPQVWFQGFGDSSLDFDLLVWIREPPHKERIRSDLYYLVEANLRRYQIEIPFPQRDLHVRSPQIEELISLWNAKSKSELAASLTSPEPRQSQTIGSNMPQALESPCDELLSELVDCSILLRQKGDLCDEEMAALIRDMRGPYGVEIKDRRYHLRVFSNCFVGSDAVAWLMHHQKATAEEAIRIGRLLVERGIFHHVTDEHTFEDQYLFYRFYEDEI